MAIRQIVDIVKSIVEQLGFAITITSNTDLGGGKHKLFMSNTYYLTKKKGIKIDGNEYIVLDFKFNEFITINPVGHTNPVTVDTFDLDAPIFFHGTVSETDREVVLFMLENPDSYPIAYLFENIRETISLDRLNPVDRTAPIQLFLLDIANYADNLSEDYLEDVLKPLSNIETKFLEVIRKDKTIGKLTGTYNRGNLSKFARFDNNGATKLVFSEELTALEIGITLPIRKKC